MKRTYTESIEWNEDGTGRVTVTEIRDLGDGKPAENVWSKDTDIEEIYDNYNKVGDLIKKVAQEVDEKEQDIDKYEQVLKENPVSKKKLEEFHRLMAVSGAKRKLQTIRSELEVKREDFLYKDAMLTARKKSLENLPEHISERLEALKSEK